MKAERNFDHIDGVYKEVLDYIYDKIINVIKEQEYKILKIFANKINNCHLFQINFLDQDSKIVKICIKIIEKNRGSFISYCLSFNYSYETELLKKEQWIYNIYDSMNLKDLESYFSDNILQRKIKKMFDEALVYFKVKQDYLELHPKKNA